MTRPEPSSSAPLLVLYDADCGACIWLLSRFLLVDRRRVLAVTPIQSEREGVLAGVPDDRVLTSWHVRTPSGEVRSAGAALVTVLRALPLLSLWGLLLGAAPGLAERLYVAVASRRAGVARLLPQGWKDQARLTVAQRQLTSATPDASAPVRTAGVPAPRGPAREADPVGALPPVTGPAATAVREADLPVLPPPAEPASPAATALPQVVADPVPASELPAAEEPAPEEPGPPAQEPGSTPGPAPGTPAGDTSIRSALRLIASHLRPLRMRMAAGLVLMVLAAVIGLGQPLATRYVLNTLASGASLRNAVLLLIALVLAAAASQGSGQYLVLRSTEDVVLSSRRRLVDRLLDLSVSGMRQQKPGDLMARVTSDTALLRQIALQSLVQFVTGTVVIIGSTVAMVLLDLVLFAVTAAVVGALGLVLGLIMPRIRRSARETQRNVGEVGSELERVLGAYVTVKAAGAEEIESERVATKLVRAHDSGVRTALWNSLAGMTSGLAVQAAFLVVLGFGGWRVQSGNLSVATLIAFLLYAMQLSSPVVQLTQAVSSFQAGRAALERIAEVERMEREAHPELEQTPDSPLVPGSQAALGPVTWERAAEFEAVTFRYPGSPAPAVKELSLTIPPCGVTAIVGPSGSGKSSVLRLIEGFYPLEHGAVRVAGRSLAEWDLGELRRYVAYVEQETPVFAGSLADNVTYGLDEVPEQLLMDVLRRAGLADRVPTVEETDMEVGHRGSALSGGERQRVAIARALLRSPRILLLDEATSQLDAATEARMRDLVTSIGKDIAVVLVAHRLSTVVQADQIVVMENGRIRACGRHEQLLRSDELYRGLVAEQQALGTATLAPAGSA